MVQSRPLIRVRKSSVKRVNAHWNRAESVERGRELCDGLWACFRRPLTKLKNKTPETSFNKQPEGIYCLFQPIRSNTWILTWHGRTYFLALAALFERLASFTCFTSLSIGNIFCLFWLIGWICYLVCCDWPTLVASRCLGRHVCVTTQTSAAERNSVRLAWLHLLAINTVSILSSDFVFVSDIKQLYTVT